MTSDTFTRIYDILQVTCEEAVEWMTPLYFYAQASFCDFTSKINFNYFCLIYSIIFLFIASKLSKTNNFRPKTRQLKSYKEVVKDNLLNIAFQIPFVKSYVYGKFNKEMQSTEKELMRQLSKNWDDKRAKSLPYEGMSEQNLRKRINQWKNKESKLWRTGKISGAFYTTDEEHYRQVNDFAAMYMYQNPLHLDTYKELLKMQSEVVQMTGNLLTQNSDNFHGTLTSGGSESLILALYAYRNFYSQKQKPNIVIPVTAHAALDKGCFYFNIQARKARLDKNYRVDLKHLQSLIDKNTIMIVGSAPNYPHGIEDPIEELAKIAKRKNIGFHIDGCLGGFVGTFHPKYKDLYSLDRDGVTSVSIDHHKFGLAPKGVSSIFYKTKELRHCQYFITIQWTGGIYGTPTFPGSRSGFATAGAWYSLTQLTKKQYKKNAEQIVNATQETAEKLRKIKGVTVFGDPHLCVIAFGTSCSHLLLADFLNYERGWSVAPIHKPDGLHLSLTLANYENIKNNLFDDVNDGIRYLEENSKNNKESAATALYGANTKIPTGFLQSEVLKCCIRASLK